MSRPLTKTTMLATNEFIQAIESWIIERYAPNGIYFDDMQTRLDYDDEEFKKNGLEDF